MKPAKRKNTNWKQSLATFFLLAGTITLTPCGSGGDSFYTPSEVLTPDPSKAPTQSSVSTPEPTSTSSNPTDTDTFSRVNTDVLQAKCVMCHMNGGWAGGTALTCANPSSSTHDLINYNVVVNYYDAADSNKAKYLQKAQGGPAHGGAAVIKSSSNEFNLLNDWINSLKEEEEEVTQAPTTTTMPTVRGFLRTSS